MNILANQWLWPLSNDFLLVLFGSPLKTFFTSNVFLLILYIEGKLELDCDLDLDGSVSMPQTPAAPATRPTRSRRRVRIEEESSDEDSPSVVPTTQHTVQSRSQRASKTAAMKKMSSATRSLKIDEMEELDEEDSDVTAEDYDASD